MSSKSFIPPKLNYPALWFTDFSLPFLMKQIHNIEGVVISEEDKNTLKKFRKERFLFIANHPSRKEPPVCYAIANLMNTRFTYMASREIFDEASGLVGTYIQSIGAFSVLAGANDRESLKMAREILRSPEGHLVLFPEGEPNGWLNDTMIPFQPGVSQLGFWGLEDAVKDDPSAKLYVLSAFIKYRMSDRKEVLQRDVDESLRKMEAKLGISRAGKTVSHRILSVGKRILEREEKNWGIAADPDKEDFDFRIGRIRHTLLDTVAEKLIVPNWNKEDNAIDKLRRLLSSLETVLVGNSIKGMDHVDKELAKWARKVCAKAYDYIALKTTYLTELPSAERIYEWIYRFEKELFGEYKERPHKAHVNLCAPILMNDWLPSYKSNKKETVTKFTEFLREILESKLQAEIAKSETLFPNDHIFAE